MAGQSMERHCLGLVDLLQQCRNAPSSDSLEGVGIEWANLLCLVPPWAAALSAVSCGTGLNLLAWVTWGYVTCS